MKFEYNIEANIEINNTILITLKKERPVRVRMTQYKE